MLSPFHTFTQSLAQGADWTFLVSPWKPILILLPFLPWAWLISTKLDKDAAYYHLNRVRWNVIQLVAGGVALAAMLAIEIFYVGWFVGIIVLLAPILVYWKYRNSEVPEGEQYHLSSESLRARFESRKRDKARAGAIFTFIDQSGEVRDVPQKESPLFPTHLLIEDIVGPALDARASRVDLAPGKNGYLVIQTIDGVKYRRDPVPVESANPVIDYVKDLAGLDVQNRRRRQVGEMVMNGPSGKTKVTVTTAGSSAGQELRLEFNRADRANVPFDNLGLLQPQIEVLRKTEARENRHGVMLLGAPPGHGLTTMSLSFVGRHDAYTTNVKTLEREIIFRHDGVDHTQFDADNPDLDFATNLQSIMRRDPDVILVADIMDKDTARVVAENSSIKEGSLVYVSQRLPGVKEQIVDWVKRVGDIKTAVRPLRGVVNGRLVRTLCPNCRQPYRPSPEQLQRLHLSADKVPQLFKANGKVQEKNKIENCPVCKGTGYFGQTGVFEAMMIDDQARNMISNNDLPGAYTHCRRNKMIFMQEAALRKVVEGITSLEEVARVMGGSGASSGSGGPKPQPAPVASH